MRSKVGVGVAADHTLLTQQILSNLGVSRKDRMGAIFARFRRQPAASDEAPRGPSRVTDQDKAVFVREIHLNYMILIIQCVCVWPCFPMCRN